MIPNLEFFKGDTVEIPIEIVTFDSEGTEAPYSLLSKTAFFVAKRRPGDVLVDAVINKEWSSHTDAANGITTVSLTADDLAEAATLYYFIGVINESEQRLTFFEGSMKIKQGAV